MPDPSFRLEFLDDPAAFLTRAGAHLAADPVLNTVVASVTARMAQEGDGDGGDHLEVPRWWVLVTDDAGEVVGAGMRTAPFLPYPLYLLPMPDAAAAELARALHARGEPLGGVNGARPAVDVCAAEWTALTGEPTRVEIHTRLFELVALTMPAPVPGRLRAATEADLDLALDWFRRFKAEADEQAGRAPTRSGEHFDAGFVRQRIAAGGVWLWVDETGRVVHLTATSVPAYDVVRIGPVFTPREHRGRGYAASAVAEVSQRLLGEGLRVCLFADQANPTSNALYQRLGYRPVVDMAEVLVGEAVSSG